MTITAEQLAALAAAIQGRHTRRLMAVYMEAEHETE